MTVTNGDGDADPVNVHVVDDLGPPHWAWRILVVLAALVAVAVVVVVGIVGSSGLKRISQNRQTSERADCRAQIQQARRDVLDQLSLRLDIDRTSHDQLLGEALLGSRLPDPRSIDVLTAEYLKVYDLLTMDKKLASTLPDQLPNINHIVDHGGDMPVLHDSGDVTIQHFDACPTVD